MLFKTLAFAAALFVGTAEAATKVTGCSCNGYSYTYTNKFGVATTYVSPLGTVDILLALVWRNTRLANALPCHNHL